MADTDLQHRAEAVWRFNRFYTQHRGVLEEGLLKSSFSLTEARVIYELARRERAAATELNEVLKLDAGYLSRILRGFEKRGLIGKKPSADDARKNTLWLTEEGQAVFASLDARSRNEIETLLSGLPAAEQERLVGAMRATERILGPQQPERKAPYLLRSHRSGDMGWTVWRHGVLYAEEYGWNEEFEALVANIAAEFIQNYNPEQERCWIAEMGGKNVGSVFLVKKSEAVAKLRLLLVEPEARGLGVGTRLVDECVQFARRAGYEKITLWTNSVLKVARHIYEKAGFGLVREESHHSFGHDLVGETWEMNL